LERGCLRVLGLHKEQNYGRYYYALNKAKWSCLGLSRTLLGIVSAYAAGTDGILRFNLDDTLVRRQGKKIKLKGPHHDGVRSRGKYKVITQGIRWLSLQLNCKFPWSEHYWSLPILTLPYPSKNTCAKEDIRYRSGCKLSRIILRLLRRWLPDRRIEVLADNAFETAKLCLLADELNITLITRSQGKMCLYDPAPEELPKGRRGPKPKKGARQTAIKERFNNGLLTFVLPYGTEMVCYLYPLDGSFLPLLTSALNLPILLLLVLMLFVQTNFFKTIAIAGIVKLLSKTFATL